MWGGGGVGTGGATRVRTCGGNRDRWGNRGNKDMWREQGQVGGTGTSGGNRDSGNVTQVVGWEKRATAGSLDK